jgi:hypothetical protein
MFNFSNPDSIEKLKREPKTLSTEGRKVMFTTRKMIVSGSRWLFAAFILSLCLAVPAPCAAASSANHAARADQLLSAAKGLAADPPDIFIPKPPPPPDAPILPPPGRF